MSIAYCYIFSVFYVETRMYGDDTKAPSIDSRGTIHLFSCGQRFLFRFHCELRFHYCYENWNACGQSKTF